jgi:phage shock protein PspC (stress-responsive transcriptional regulator)
MSDTQDSKIFCTQCGVEHGIAVNFCSQCGHQMRDQQNYQNQNLRGGPRRLLHRSMYDKKLGGVCSGLAEYFDADVTLIRLVVVAGTIMSAGLGFLSYIAAWIIMPLEPGANAYPHSAPVSV